MCATVGVSGCELFMLYSQTLDDIRFVTRSQIYPHPPVGPGCLAKVVVYGRMRLLPLLGSRTHGVWDVDPRTDRWCPSALAEGGRPNNFVSSTQTFHCELETGVSGAPPG